MKDLEGKVAFITGGGSGVAFGQAKVFAEEAGMKVVIADIRQDHLDQAMAGGQGDASGLTLREIERAFGCETPKLSRRRDFLFQVWCIGRYGFRRRSSRFSSCRSWRSYR